MGTGDWLVFEDDENDAYDHKVEQQAFLAEAGRLLGVALSAPVAAPRKKKDVRDRKLVVELQEGMFA